MSVKNWPQKTIDSAIFQSNIDVKKPYPINLPMLEYFQTGEEGLTLIRMAGGVLYCNSRNFEQVKLHNVLISKKC